MLRWGPASRRGPNGVPRRAEPAGPVALRPRHQPDHLLPIRPGGGRPGIPILCPIPDIRVSSHAGADAAVGKRRRIFGPTLDFHSRQGGQLAAHTRLRTWLHCSLGGVRISSRANRAPSLHPFLFSSPFPAISGSGAGVGLLGELRRREPPPASSLRQFSVSRRIHVPLSFRGRTIVSKV